jgi:hypothetical protein
MKFFPEIQEQRFPEKKAAAPTSCAEQRNQRERMCTGGAELPPDVQNLGEINTHTLHCSMTAMD